MMRTDPPATGWLNSLGKFLDTGLGIVQNRVELFAVELQEEKSHVVGMVVWLVVALFLGMLSMIVLTGAIILITPAEGRVYAAAALFVLYLLGAILAVVKLKGMIRQRAQDLPFAETLNEVKKDRAWLHEQKLAE